MTNPPQPSDPERPVPNYRTRPPVSPGGPPAGGGDRPGSGTRAVAFTVGIILLFIGVGLLFSANGLQFAVLVLGSTLATGGFVFLAAGVILTGVLAATEKNRP